MRHWIIVAFMALLTGCSGMKIEEFEGSTPTFRPEEYFLGQTKAWGFFQDRFGAIKREFIVDITGSMEGDVLVLDEKFDYRDGEKDRRIWRITKTGDNTYEGVADDIVGTATGTAVGRAMRWRYDFDLEVSGSTYRVHFDDWMFLQDEKVMMNRSTISKWGFKLGDVIIFFDRVQPAEADNQASTGDDVSADIRQAALEHLYTAAE